MTWTLARSDTVRAVDREAGQQLALLQAQRGFQPPNKLVENARAAVASLQSRRGHLGSLGFARLCIWVPELTLAMGGKSGELQQVESYAELALRATRSSNKWSGNYVSTNVHIGLIHGVLLKALDNYPESEQVMLETQQHLAGKRLVEINDPALVDITRQLALNTQNRAELKRLAFNVYPRTREGRLQQFTSLKRYIEILLNSVTPEDAEELSGLLAAYHRLYGQVRGELGDLGRLSFRKNIAHYLLKSPSAHDRLIGTERAVTALRGAQRVGYDAQAQQLTALLEAADKPGTDIKLRTFRAGDLFGNHSVAVNIPTPEPNRTSSAQVVSRCRRKLRDLRLEIHRYLEDRYSALLPELDGLPHPAISLAVVELERLDAEVEHTEYLTDAEGARVEDIERLVANLDEAVQPFRRYRKRVSL